MAEAQQFSSTAELEVQRLRDKLLEYEGDAHKSEELARTVNLMKSQLAEAEISHRSAQEAVDSKQVSKLLFLPILTAQTSLISFFL